MEKEAFNVIGLGRVCAELVRVWLEAKLKLHAFVWAHRIQFKANLDFVYRKKEEEEASLGFPNFRMSHA